MTQARPSAWSAARTEDGPVRRLARRLTGACVIALILTLGLPAEARAAGDPGSAPAEPPAKVQQILDLLSDPEVQSWIQAHRGTGQVLPEAVRGAEATPPGFLSQRLAAFREHFEALAAVPPGLPEDFNRARATLMKEEGERPVLTLFGLLAGLLALGFGSEWVFDRYFQSLRDRLAKRSLETGAGRLAVAATRLGFELAGLLAFALGSVALFAFVAWPPAAQLILVGYLAAFLGTRLALILSRFLLAPRAPNGARLALLPLRVEVARFWRPRLVFVAGWFLFGWVSVGLLDEVGFPGMDRLFVAYVLGLVLLGAGLEAVWRQPRGPGVDDHRSAHDLTRWLLSAYFILLFVLWVAWALIIFWFAVVIVAVPAALGLTHRAVDHWLRASDGPAGASPAPSLLAVCLKRGLQDAIILGGALTLAHFWHLNLAALTTGDSMLTRLARGVLSVVIIGMLADFGWQLAKAAIDRKIAAPPPAAGANSEAGRRQARLRTLLPILRNLLFILLVAMVLMLALATMGVDIAPLIAGAGVIGVAIGFGSQTLVKDIISGMFYLLDDAFRVGEYIQSGDFKGTVESFSLRSVKLRHHRGPLFTIPFGELGAVENMSRDWVIEKLSVGVAYDTDLAKVKKLIKRIGEELQRDPELGPHILEPLKMQGVEEFGDFAIEIRMKMMTKPGEQFAVRRRAYAMIKDAFDANGIEMPLPTVQVAGGDGAAAAAAQRGLAMVKQSSQS